MQKFKKVLILCLIIVLIPLTILGLDDEYDELDYVWLEEEIANAKNASEPKISSRYAVVFDRTSKTVIWGKDENKEVPMASTTKIMTAIVMLENIKDLSQKVTVCKQAAGIGGSRLGLQTNDEITYKDLLYGLLLCSGNDAAVQIAVSVAGGVENFAELMNQKAEALGLTHSHFVTPHGLDNENHYTTAYELALIADYALNIETFAKVVSTSNYTVSINGYPKNIHNSNELLGYLDGVNGIKTGFTNGAGRCLVTSVSRNNFNIITVVLGADTKKIRTSDSIKLIEYTYKNYTLIDISEILKEEFENWKNINKNRFIINKGIGTITPILGTTNSIFYPIPISSKNDIWVNIENNSIFNAPLSANFIIGSAHILLNTTEIAHVEILNSSSIIKKGVLDYFKEILTICL